MCCEWSSGVVQRYLHVMEGQSFTNRTNSRDVGPPPPVVWCACQSSKNGRYPLKILLFCQSTMKWKRFKIDVLEDTNSFPTPRQVFKKRRYFSFCLQKTIFSGAGSHGENSPYSPAPGLHCCLPSPCPLKGHWPVLPSLVDHDPPVWEHCCKYYW